jgi:N-acetylglutamate synthase-like GNAT family acetyltransferase
MEIIDFEEKYAETYFHCLEDWSDEIKEAGNHKKLWYSRMKEKGFRVKLALENDSVIGMIQYIPVEHSLIDGKDLYFINCIWVHGYNKGVGNHQKKGVGKSLLNAVEEDVKSQNSKGIAAWGVSMPFWMKASWFKKHGFKKVDKDGMAVLMWKPFTEDAIPPKWIKGKKTPGKTANKVTVTTFKNGWCPALNLAYERAKRASLEFGDKIDFQEINTFNREVFLDWGISDALFIDGKKIRTGPPPSYDKIRKKISKKIKKLNN